MIALAVANVPAARREPATSAAELVHQITSDPEYAARWDGILARSKEGAMKPRVMRAPMPTPAESAGWSDPCRRIVELANESAVDAAYDDEAPELDRDYVLSAAGQLAAERPDMTTDAILAAIREALRFAGCDGPTGVVESGRVRPEGQGGPTDPEQERPPMPDPPATTGQPEHEFVIEIDGEPMVASVYSPATWERIPPGERPEVAAVEPDTDYRLVLVPENPSPAPQG